MTYRNVKEQRTTVIIPLWMKELIVKDNMNLSYFVREKLDAHFKNRKGEK